jgi:pimeloyl-ACP methyl ester carboxylesterase
MNQLVDVGETKLYCEVIGTGPSVVLVPGASGDGGYMQPLADALADEFQVATYDRRGNSRSPGPEGWTQTSAEEQARDLAGLIRALDLAPTVVLGNSYGAVIALCAVMAHERYFRGALLHDATLMSVLEHPEDSQAILRPMIEEAMAKGGPRAAMEAFVEFAFGGSARALPDAVIDRMLGNAEVLFGVEFGSFESWRPHEERLRALPIPVCPLVGKESPPFSGEAASWVAARVGSEVVEVPGGHVGFIDNGHEFAEVTRPLIRSMT